MNKCIEDYFNSIRDQDPKEKIIFRFKNMDRIFENTITLIKEDYRKQKGKDQN